MQEHGRDRSPGFVEDARLIITYAKSSDICC